MMGPTALERRRSDAETASRAHRFLELDEELISAPGHQHGSSSYVRDIGSPTRGAQRISVDHLVEAPATSPPSARRRVLQVWLGVVSEVGDREFFAVLQDQTDTKRANERVTVDVQEVDPQ